MRVSAVLLAAGMSTRMGEQNKLLLPLGGKAIITHSLEALLGTNPTQVVVVLGHQASLVRETLSLFEGKVDFITNPNYDSGMTSSIQTGVAALRGASPGVMICLGDMPFLTTSNLLEFGSAFTQAAQTDSRSIVVPTYQGKRGNPVTFSMDYRDEMIGHTFQEGLKGLVKSNQDHVVEVPSDARDVRLDIDTPEEYQQVQDLWKQRNTV